MTNNRISHQTTKWAPLALIFVLVASFSLLTVGCSSENSIESTSNQFNADDGVSNLTLTDQILEEALGESNNSFAKAGTSRTLKTEVLPQIPTVLTFATGAAQYDHGGFVLTVDFNGETVVFRFPGDAVTEETAYLLGADSTITIQGVRNSTAGIVTYEYVCAPHGLVFTDAVQLTQPYSAPTGTNLGLYYYDPTAMRDPWDLQEVTTVTGGVANFNLWHFSKYGISR